MFKIIQKININKTNLKKKLFNHNKFNKIKRF